jgi:hypothetical protein
MDGSSGSPVPATKNQRNPLMTRVSVFNDHPTNDSVAVRVAVERFYIAFRIFSSELYMEFRPAKLVIPVTSAIDRRW